MRTGISRRISRRRQRYESNENEKLQKIRFSGLSVTGKYTQRYRRAGKIRIQTAFVAYNTAPGRRKAKKMRRAARNPISFHREQRRRTHPSSVRARRTASPARRNSPQSPRIERHRTRLMHGRKKRPSTRRKWVRTPDAPCTSGERSAGGVRTAVHSMPFIPKTPFCGSARKKRRKEKDRRSSVLFAACQEVR